MNLKYIAKKIVIAGLIGIMTMGSLTGCLGKTKLVFTTGLSGNQLFKIGSATCTTPEIMIYLTTFYNQYVEIYGEEMWHYDFGGVSLEDHVKDVVLSKTAQIKIMNLMAKEYGITLSGEEKSRVREAAGKYYDMLKEELKDREKITEGVAEKVYLEYALANKVYETITESADMEISDDEARTVTVQMIYFRNWKITNNEKTALNDSETEAVLKKAKKVLEQIEDGADFETLATNYSDNNQILKKYARGSVDGKFEELLFSMDQGDVSGIVELQDGYYIVKCISTMDYEATQENKLVLAEKKKREAFLEAYEKIAENTYSQIRKRKWEKITLDEEIYRTDANFFDVYDEFMKK